MNTLKLIALSIIAILFASCKASQPTGPGSSSGPSLVEGVQILDSVQAKFYDLAQANLSSTPGQVMLLTAAWLETQPNVQNVGAYDSTDLDIQLKSGLHTIFSSYTLGPDSLSLTRGGGNPAPGLRLSPNIQSTNIITNKKVLIYTPYVASQHNCQYCLYHQEDMDALQNLFSRAGSDFDITINYGTSLNDLKTFGDYGLVFIDTHGLPNAFYTSIEFEEPSALDSSGHVDPTVEIQLENFIDQDFGSGTAELLKNGSLLLAGWSNEGSAFTWQQYLKRNNNPCRIVVGGKYISGLPAMPNTIIVGNFCYSGWQIAGPTNALARYPITINDPIQPAFTSKQLISYYSYGYTDGTAGPVGDKFALAMEDSLISKLVLGTDSTGSAFTDASGQMYVDRNYRNDLFQHSGADDYSYVKCGDTLIDPRDGQTYPTVCIGKQIWMAKDLNYNTIGSMCYDSVNSSCDVYGRLYTWDGMMQGAASTNANPSGVQGVCPKGWHVPSNSEWEQMDGTLTAGGDLKDTILWESPNAGATNITGFSALPGGYRVGIGFSDIGKSIMFGASTITSDYQQWWGLNYYDGSLSPTVGGQPGDNSAAYCRCVKDP